MGRRTRTVRTLVSATIATAATLLAIATPAAATTTAPAIAQTSATAATTDATTAYCDVTFAVITQWANGYGASITIRNISTVPVRWELLRIWFPAPLQAIQTWNATATQAGSVVTIYPSPSSGLLAPGEVRMIGVAYATGSYVTPPPYQVTCTPA